MMFAVSTREAELAPIEREMFPNTVAAEVSVTLVSAIQCVGTPTNPGAESEATSEAETETEAEAGTGAHTGAHTGTGMQTETERMRTPPN